MTTRVPVQPRMLEWALLRSGKDPEEVEKRFPKFQDWLKETEQPTLRQLEDFAKAMYVPFGYLFFPEPPEEKLPIPDFRTVGSRGVRQPSPNLLDTIYNYQNCQSWYREFARDEEHDPVSFVGTATMEMAHEEVAKTIRTTLGFDRASPNQFATPEDALGFFMGQAGEAGVLVMRNGVVQNNTSRNLDVQEFRGFALVDDLAPLVFINGKDSKHAQIFTLAHELAHLWLGKSGVSDTTAQPLAPSIAKKEEIWCNQVAAELLVPLDELRKHLRSDESVDKAKQRLSRHFNVSGLVILRRLLDVEWLTRSVFDVVWDKECDHIHRFLERSGSRPGGGFYATVRSRLGSRFIRALVGSTLGGKTLYRDAFRMLGINNTATFKEMGRNVGISI